MMVGDAGADVPVGTNMRLGGAFVSFAVWVTVVALVVVATGH